MLRYLTLAFLFSTVLLSPGTTTADPKAPTANPPPAIVNPAIDMEGYLRVSNEAAKHRETRRLTEDEFIRMSKEKGTIVLDARSKEMYDLLHVKGAINLSFSDIAIDTLKQTLPDKNAHILIYCNNNFRNGGRAFLSKMPTASLNLSTYIALYNYGYRNVYELGPLLDPKASKLTFESAPVKPVLPASPQRQARE